MGRQRSGIGTGILLITLGAIFLIDRSSLHLGFGNLWPLLLIVGGASKMFFRDVSMRIGVVAGRRGCRRESRWSGMWLIVVGGNFLLDQNHLYSIHQTWPLFIVAAGLGIIFSGIFNRRDADTNPGDSTIGGGGQQS
jgi:hypothetical protein